MSGLFSKPTFPPITPASAVSDDAESVKEAARLEADRLRKRRGMQSTILTGPSGITEQASTLKATLG